MNLRDLEYVVAVADHGHFGRAAAACNVSQPTLSGQILKLEGELGLRLFDREGRGARVSDRAAIVVAQARATLAAAAGVSAAADAARDPFAGELRLGIITTVAPYLLPIALPGLAEALPRDAPLSGGGSDRPASCALARRRPRRRGHRDRPARRQAGVDRALRRAFLPRLFRSYEKARARLNRRRGDRSEHPSAAGRGSLSARSGAWRSARRRRGRRLAPTSAGQASRHCVISLRPGRGRRSRPSSPMPIGGVRAPGSPA